MVNIIKQKYKTYKLTKQIKKQLSVRLTSVAYPEQYNIKYDGVTAGYIRIRGGILSILFTPSGDIDYTSIVLFAKNYEQKSINNFRNDLQKLYYIEKAKNLIAKTLAYDTIAAGE